MLDKWLTLKIGDFGFARAGDQARRARRPGPRLAQGWVLVVVGKGWDRPRPWGGGGDPVRDALICTQCEVRASGVGAGGPGADSQRTRPDRTGAGCGGRNGRDVGDKRG